VNWVNPSPLSTTFHVTYPHDRANSLALPCARLRIGRFDGGSRATRAEKRLPRRRSKRADQLPSLDGEDSKTEVEKAANEIFDKDLNVRDSWNDHGVGSLLSIGASVQTTDKEFPQVAAAIHKAGFSTREYVVCFLTLLQAQNAVYFKKQGKSKEYPPYVNPINTKLLEDHWDEVVRIMNPPRSDTGK
jgi:hypothetical protein